MMNTEASVLTFLLLLHTSTSFKPWSESSLSWPYDDKVTEMLHVFMPLPNVLIASKCSWEVHINQMENRIPSRFYSDSSMYY